MRIILLLALSSIVFAQDNVFLPQAAPLDNVVLTNTTSVGGAWIFKNNLNTLEGKATLFVGGDSLTGTTGVVTVTYQLYFGNNDAGQALLSEVLALGTVAAALQKSTFDNGSDIVGEHFDMATITDWSIAKGVKFYFVGTGTHTTRVISKLIWR